MLTNVSRVGVIWNANNKVFTPKLLEADAVSLGIQLQSLALQGPNDLQSVFADAIRQRSQVLYVMPDPVTFDRRAEIIAFAAAKRLPAFYTYYEEAFDGGLAALGVNLREEYRRVAPYVDKILKGAVPADLPVEQSRKFGLFINMKTAKALGLTIPQGMLLRADEVIE